MAYDRLDFEELREGCDAGDVKSMRILGDRMLYGRGMSRNYEGASDLIMNAAVNGDAKAMVEWGDMVGNDYKLDCREEVAAMWYRAAANKGLPEGIWKLSKCYMKGRGTEYNPSLGYSLCRRAAKSGFVPALVDLGKIYRDEQDYVRAAQCFRKAAEKGDAESQYEIGMLFLEGKGVKQSNKRAFKWFKAASEGQERRAYLMVCRMMRNGLGTEKDVPGAVKVCEVGVENLCSTAVPEVLDIFLNEPGYQDDLKVRAWAHRVIQERIVDALDAVADLYSEGRVLEKDPDMEQAVLEMGSSMNSAACKFKLASFIRNNPSGYAPGKASQLVLEAAEMGYEAAQYERYYELRDTDPDEAAYWLRRCAMSGASYGMIALAKEYEAGEIVYQSDSMAIKWYTKAYDAGHVMARTPLLELLSEADPFEEGDSDDVDILKRIALEDGDCGAYRDIGDHYMDEENEDFDVDMAIRWYSRGADIGMGECMDRLGFILYYGIGGDREPEAALGYISKAAAQGMPESQYILGINNLSGKYLKRDPILAKKWLERAAFQGHAEARKKLELQEEEESMRGLSALFG